MDFSLLFKQGAKLAGDSLSINTSPLPTPMSTLSSEVTPAPVCNLPPINTPKKQIQDIQSTSETTSVDVKQNELHAKISPKGADKTLHMHAQALSVLTSLGSVRSSADNTNNNSCSESKKRPLSLIAETISVDKDERTENASKKQKHQVCQFARSNCWSYEEEVVLIGAVMDRFLTYGSLVSARRRKKKLGVEKGFVEMKQSASPKSKNEDNDADDAGEVDDQECWSSIKEVYDEGLKRIGDASVRPYRSMNALCRHYKVMKARKEIKFQDLFDSWLETDYAAELRNQTYSDDEQEKTPETLLGKDIKDKQRSNSWKREEEVMLIGAVVTRFLEFGSLVKKKEECWGQIKATFELAWGNYSKMVKVAPSYIRTVNALHRHYKVMKARRSNLYPYYNEWRRLTSGTNSILSPSSNVVSQGSTNTKWSEREKKEHWLKVEKETCEPVKAALKSRELSSVPKQIGSNASLSSVKNVAQSSPHHQQPPQQELNYAQLQNQILALNTATNGNNMSMMHSGSNVSNSVSPIQQNASGFNQLAALSMMGVFNMPSFGNIQNMQIPNMTTPNMQTMLSQMAFMNGFAQTVPQMQNSNVMNASNLTNLNMQMMNINTMKNMANFNMNMMPNMNSENNSNSAGMNNHMGNIASDIMEVNQMPKPQNVKNAAMRSETSPLTQESNVSHNHTESTIHNENTTQETNKQKYPKQFPRESFRERYNCWTLEEEVILVGIVVERFLSRGSLVSHRKREDGKSKDENDLECWNSIHECFEKALSKYCKIHNQFRPHPRSTLAMRRHYKVIKSKRNQGGLRHFYTKWKTFNKDKALLNKEEMRNQEIKSEDSKTEIIEFDNCSSKDRWDSWIHLEEVVLIGCVVERFLKFGSLVSVRKKGDKGVEVDDCWKDIKSCYDHALDVCQDNSGARPACKRSSNALSRHYKVMKARRLPCGRLANELGKYFDEWSELKEKHPRLFLSE